MTVTEAAKIIGCASTHVRWLIARGAIMAKLVPHTEISLRWDIDKKEAIRYRDTPQKRGYPRGRKRPAKEV